MWVDDNQDKVNIPTSYGVEETLAIFKTLTKGVNFASFVWVHVESFGEKAHPNRKSPKNSKYNYIASGEKYLRIISRYFRTATRALIRYFFYQFIRSLRERQITVVRKSTRPCAMPDLTNQKRRGCRTL